MKRFFSHGLSVLILVAAIAGSLYLSASMALGDGLPRMAVVGLGVLTAGFLILFAGTALTYFLVRRFEEKPGSDVGMPVLRPIPIPTRTRSLLMRVIVWLHQVRTWEVAENWEFTLPTDGTRIVIHKGFRFDGASIPRPLWAVLNPIGLLLIQGLIHDYGYRYRQLWKVENGRVSPYEANGAKSTWDRIFRETGRAINGTTIINFAAWLAVYLGGWGAWRNNRKRNEPIVVPEGMTLASAAKHRAAAAGS